MHRRNIYTSAHPVHSNKVTTTLIDWYWDTGNYSLQKTAVAGIKSKDRAAAMASNSVHTWTRGDSSWMLWIYPAVITPNYDQPHLMSPHSDPQRQSSRHGFKLSSHLNKSHLMNSHSGQQSSAHLCVPHKSWPAVNLSHPGWGHPVWWHSG
jgi:hypothetical protein